MSSLSITTLVDELKTLKGQATGVIAILEATRPERLTPEARRTIVRLLTTTWEDVDEALVALANAPEQTTLHFARTGHSYPRESEG